jgi:hypothetical protein
MADQQNTAQSAPNHNNPNENAPWWKNAPLPLKPAKFSPSVFHKTDPWWKNGKLHRLDAPYKYTDGDK